MQLLHISDTHLGKRQYNLESREKDVYDTFTQLIDIAINEHVKAVIHTGDLFDVNNPPNRAKLHAIKELKRLKDHNIPFICIAGDHDSPKRKEEIYPQRILEEFNLIKILQKIDNRVKLENVEVYGISHISNVSVNDLKEQLSKVKPETRKSILMLHQGIRTYLPYQGAWQIELSDLPKGFSLYAVGHLHSRRKDYLDGGALIEIAGSPDIMREEEIEDYQKSKKGATLIDMSGDLPSINYINVNIRDQLVLDINVDKIEQSIESVIQKLKENVKNDKKPILHIELEGTVPIRKDVLMTKLQALRDYVEHYRIYKNNIVSIKEENLKTKLKTTYSSLNDIIADYLKGIGYTDEETKIIIDIINEEDEKKVEELLKKFAGVEDK
ncbi:DNA double-strand break repair protein Mre11 [Sulfolobus acidocaldarius]|uniref:DNA double-strand break repair protein Mre11 n=4 Tax=Sulfolobus acidocaldarius TaxID=2285 RepID=MRE11_SULAC|nr:DNA double-strand break repair protein Mre11 [Sulfolobus acidocaldarius]Q8NKQ0.1 RecName: Full=DNA double-strand break repair protein Mre11 [Sulfolobus acidocaldarius DSM 639]AAY79482.1 DNA double-strand break repair Mre11 nuclease [Sulfolobus acidocaldarius DSM 639]AGE70031.1 DNA double-strand break repair Mre11 nuclease [Sulfolobus acidocaldarius N8]AGE72306.1 DNA double-strand break repair Mre11 nuclease [Sulfolobus acidocaldarius Ron12/I]ALU29542.1 hydroxyacid dehydrogenase [Sulfolobus 